MQGKTVHGKSTIYCIVCHSSENSTWKHQQYIVCHSSDNSTWKINIILYVIQVKTAYRLCPKKQPIQWDFHSQERIEVKFVQFNFIDESLRYNHLTEEV